MRGEYDIFLLPYSFRSGSSPLARGIQYFLMILRAVPRIIPACAGNTLFCRNHLTFQKDHPRLRGEYQKEKIAKAAKVGSSPLARGILSFWVYTISCAGIIPACAGNTHIFCCGTEISRDHPRLRGEYPESTAAVYVSSGSSPLARGIQRSPKGMGIGHRIIPACAGNTKSKSRYLEECKDHPRLRGEYTKKSLIFLSFPFLL